MSFQIRGLIGPGSRVYELRWANGEFEGDRLAMGRVTLLLANPPALVRTIPTGPQIEASAAIPSAAISTARAVFTEILSETGTIPKVDGGERLGDPPGAIY